MALQSLILPILSVFRSAGLQQASGALRGLTSNFDSLAGKIGLAAGSFSAFSALTTARTFAMESVQATQLLERNILALGQVFEETQPRLIAFTKEVESYGLSQSQAAQASVFLGSVLKQYGFSVSESAGQTERLVTLAQDLATTYGYDVQEALLAITALFRGEYDPIEKFGVAMKQNEVNARLAAKGLNDLEGAALANAQAIARLEMLFERAGDSVGAFERASNTLYGSQQKLNAVIGNLQVAAGAPLQEPLAAINNIFTEIFETSGPGIVDIFEALGQFIDVIGPTLGQLTTLLLNVIQPLQQLINIFAGVLAPILNLVVVPALATINSVFESINSQLDAASAIFDSIGLIFRRMIMRMEANEVFGFYLEFFGWFLGAGNLVVQIIDNVANAFDDLAGAVRAANGDFDDFESSDRQLSAGYRRRAADARASKNDFEKLDAALRGAASGARDAEGKLDGLAGVFQRIDDAAGQSQAKQAMEDLGLSAAFIEEVLTRPNWEEIFGRIKRLAQLTAIDIRKVLSVTAAAGLTNEIAQIQSELEELFKSDTKDSVKDFFIGLQDEIAKQKAATRLEAMGASSGLIEAILGANEWEKIYKRVIATGKPGLQELQNQFNKTAAGIQEMADAAREYQEEQDRFIEAGRKAFEESIKELVKRADEAQKAFEKAQEAAAEFKETLSEFGGIEILPNIEIELGRFEEAVVSSIEKVRSDLKQIFRQDLILKSDFEAISAFVSTEEAALRNIAKQRDAMAKKLSLSEALIGEYQKALTGALQLTSLFSKLKGETEKRTVTEVQRGVITLGRALREFEVQVTRSYEEPIQQIQNKTEGLLQGFRDMADKARTFAENLRRLKALGLDPMLFNQLVQAGAEAGGETAQAIVDGGSEAVNELNGIFNELNKLGAELGMDVGMTMYEAGRDMTFGLLDGIKSEQERLLALARSMAEAFSREFQSKLSIAVDARVAAAASAAEQAKTAVPDIKQVDLAALGKITTLIQNAEKWLTRNLSVFERIRSEDILEIYRGLERDILAMRPIDLSGIRAGMSVEALAKEAIRAGGTNVANYYITVEADTRTGGYEAGKATVEALQKFSQVNGAFDLQVAF